MDVAGVAINAAVVAAVGLILGWLGKGRFEAVDRRIDRLEERVDHRIDSLERRMDAFQTSIDAMRSDLTQVALAVGVRPRGTNA
jgi:chaperonin cofactor prefoldin